MWGSRELSQSKCLQSNEDVMTPVESVDPGHGKSSRPSCCLFTLPLIFNMALQLGKDEVLKAESKKT